MKKIVLMLSIMGLSFFMMQCETIDYDLFFEEISTEIESYVPSVVNSNFSLPIFSNAIVTYELNGVEFDETYIYESPFFDIDTTLTYRIQKNQLMIENSVDVKLLSDDSGDNHYELYLDLADTIDHIDKELYMQTSVKAIMDKNGVRTTELSTSLAQIRGRGNSTWLVYPKKPYRLKFDEDTSIFGMPEARSYVLLAEYADKSLMRNTIVHKLSSLSDELSYTLETRFVDLYIDDTYQGLYVLTEQVEIHENKLFFETVPGIDDTGYFLELDMRFYDQNIVPGTNWILVGQVPYEIKDPNPEDSAYTASQATYIQNYIIQAENALIRQTDYEDYIDVEAWIDFFIIHEITKNVDVGYSSIYLYKTKDGKLSPGPLWDFDFSIGNADYIDYGPEGFYGMKETKNRLFGLMMNIESIRSQFKLRFLEYYITYLPMVYEMMPVLAETLREAAIRNFNTWDIMGTYVWPNPTELVEETTFLGQVHYIEQYLRDRMLWMYNEMNTDDYLRGIFN